MTEAGLAGRFRVAVTRGAVSVPDAAIAVIVMAINADSRALAAALSVTDQEPTAEIVIVNTGRGSLEPHLTPALRSRITLVESPVRQFVGAARNLGIANSRAPIIAFLAADCRATPGWLDARVSAHQRGHRMVASALRPAANERGRISSATWAAHLLTHFNRTPGTPAERAARYGVSYDRSLFARHGGFNADVRVSEDLEFNRACNETGVIAAWLPDVLTLHDYPRGIVDAAVDQFERGFLSAIYALEQDGRSLRRHMMRTAREVQQMLEVISAPRADLDFRYPLLVRAIVSLLSIALLTGIVSGAIRSRRRHTRTSDRKHPRKGLTLLIRRIFS